MDIVLTFYIGRFAIVTILKMASFEKTNFIEIEPALIVSMYCQFMHELSSASENSDFIIEFHKHAACYIPD